MFFLQVTLHNAIKSNIEWYIHIYQYFSLPSILNKQNEQIEIKSTCDMKDRIMSCMCLYMKHHVTHFYTALLIVSN